MTRLILIALALTSLAMFVNGHGVLMFPAGRLSAWRVRGFERLFRRFSDDAEWCATIDNRSGAIVENMRNVSCGIGGPIYSGNVLDYGEITSEFHRELTVASFRQGQSIDVQYNVLIDHSGVHEFSVCPASANTDPTQDCLDRNKLTFVGNHEYVSPTRVLTRSGRVNPQTGFRNYTVQLPASLTCDRCVFQSNWIGFNGQIYRSECR